MKIINFTSVLLTGVLCTLALFSAAAQPGKKKTVAPANNSNAAMDAEDYAVYSSVLTALYVKGNSGLLVIDREVSGCVRATNNAEGERAWQKSLDALPQKMAKLSAATVTDLKRKSQLCRSLSASFTVTPKVVLFEKQERKNIFTGQNAQQSWNRFKQKFPGVAGYINFSNVGFNADRTQALVDTYQKCGEKCGAEQIVLLTKVNGTWSVTALHKIWEL